MALAFDGHSGGTALAATSLTYSHTCAGSDRILFVGINFFAADAADDVTGVTYNGVTMTQITKQSIIGTNQQWSYLYYLIAPATGANNVVISKTSSDDIYSASASYTGAHQASQPDSFNQSSQTSATSITTSTTTVLDNCWVVSFALNSNTNIAADTGTTARDISQTFCGIGDSNAVVHPAGAYSMKWNDGAGGATGWTMVMASFSPVHSIAYTEDLSDTITISEPSILRAMTKSPTDTLTMTETISKAITHSFSDVFSILERFVGRFGRASSFSKQTPEDRDWTRVR